jgi:ABC-type transporter MlaC component
MIKSFTFTTFMFAAIASAPAALAQSQTPSACAPRDLVISKLEDSYGESRMGAGLRGHASVFEIWASADSGTWTIVVTNTEGISCVMASGDSWQDMPATPAKLGAPA